MITWCRYTDQSSRDKSCHSVERARNVLGGHHMTSTRSSQCPAQLSFDYRPCGNWLINGRSLSEFQNWHVFSIICLLEIPLKVNLVFVCFYMYMYAYVKFKEIISLPSQIHISEKQDRNVSQYAILIRLYHQKSCFLQ